MKKLNVQCKLNHRMIQFVFMMFFATISAKNIHVAKNGNDSNSGTASKPYKTIAKASSVAQPGDVIIIGEGTYEESIRPQRSGTPGKPIVYTAKAGEKVIISAMQALSGWRKDSGVIYKVKVDWDLGQENFVMNGNTAMDLARWPNNTDGTPFTLNSRRNDGGSGSNVSNNAFLTSSQIPNINWAGGAVFFYGDKPGSGWIAWKAFITGSSSGRVNFNLDKNPNWIRTFHAPADKGDFYLEGVKGALDYQNEWWFNANTKELFVQMPNGNAPANGVVRMRKRKVTIDLSVRSYIQIKNLAVFGGSIDMPNNSNNNVIYGVSSFYGNHTIGVQKGFSANQQSILMNGNNNVVEKCEIAFGAANGIKVGGNGNKILNSRIHDFNYLGSYDAPINARGGRNTTFKGNTIFRGGRDGIQFFNNSSEFAYNDVYQANLINDDCALLYTVGGPHNGEIHHNWFHDNQGRGKLKKAAGVYLDNDAEAFSVHHNVIWNTEWTGVQINWDGKDINVFNNTFWNNSDEMGAWHKEGTAFTNVKVWNNLGFKGEWEPQSNKQNNMVANANAFANVGAGNFRLKSGATPINKGRVINDITNGYVGSAPDVGAYEFGGTNWVAGIDWNPELGPTGQGCYGLPGESCENNTNNDKIEFVNTATNIQSQKEYTFSVKYEAKTKREITVEFWSSTSWLGGTTVQVEGGSGTKQITFSLPNKPSAGSGYIYKTHIKPLGTTWREALDTDQVNNITVTNPSSQLIQDGAHYIVSTASNQRLLSRSLENHSARMSAPLNYNDQRWVFKHLGNNVYTIKNYATNRFLEVPYAKCENRTNVATWTDANDNHKKWKVVSNGSGVYGLQPMHCIDKGLDRERGEIDANVVIWEYSKTNNNQKWKIIPFNDKNFSLENMCDILLYPNPAKNFVNVTGTIKNKEIIVYNLLGNIIKTKVATSNQETIATSDLQSGIYIISIVGGPKLQMIKE
ncbi:RICIN domain-containing protein [Aquimarina algicola]|uniref:T9SS type A sorting domain-containing protein n=1 Tax=Aquimarina algicola TaxID=2589995 RepID=A0A504IY45_9FLAO|nr:RICIN domain-containing protein [Aquimarina algicola]TPN83376.1 T9SS type A sorting domain-containing protein [Aquimarina algicola]